MAIDCMSTEVLESVGARHGLKLVVDPFHGSTAYEFQKKVDKGTRCAGCIIGPTVSTLYTRVVRGRQTEDYKEVETVPTASLDVETLSGFISAQFE